MAATSLVATLASLIAEGGAVAPVRASSDCVSLSALVSPAAFARLPVRTSSNTRDKWHRPDTRTGLAHLFRTRLREGTTGAPDFAGHYSIVRLSCGAGLVCPAFVDRRSGTVSFPANVRSVSNLPRDEAATGFDRLGYRSGSRLFAALGARNEDERTMGVSLFDWNEGKPRLLRFIPEARLCVNDGRY